MVRKITLKDLPAPFATPSAPNGPQVVARPEGAWPQVLEGFKVEQYASGLDDPRIIRTAPNGDIFVAETKAGDIRVFRGITGNGKPEQMSAFCWRPERAVWHQHFIPQVQIRSGFTWGTSDSVVRFPYQNGDLQARGAAQHMADLPDGGRPFDARYSVLA